MEKRDKARDRRSDKRIAKYAVSKKDLVDVVAEEAIEGTAAWVERGGLRRLWNILKVLALIVLIAIGWLAYSIFS